jgi:hypothetical protein
MNVSFTVTVRVFGSLLSSTCRVPEIADRTTRCRMYKQGIFGDGLSLPVSAQLRVEA